MQPRRLLIIIIFFTLLAIFIDIPKNIPVQINSGPIQIDTIIVRPDIDFTLFGRRFVKEFNLKKGLDLQGGTHVLLRADMAEIDPNDQTEALESSKNVIQKRIDLFGVNEPMIQTSVVGEEYRIIVELPGVNDVDQAVELIGRTAQLDFRELPEGATESAQIFDFLPTGLTGKNLRKATVQYGQQGTPEVSLQFDQEGAELFSEITKRNVDKPLAIFLDQYPVTAPRVNQQIRDGQAVISGSFTLEDAKDLSIQLNAGALPVPIQIIEQKNIGASLGQESIEKSMQAGLIGLGMVMLFMALYYGWLGLIADIALIIYALITLALYKLIPVTITLPGLAGFILSVGMAVDSNILIFERMKEEMRMGRPRQTAMELGFGRAWDSIKDANVATLITTFILFNPLNWSFLNTSGMVRGFALTLSLGIVISLFTGVVVSRTLIRVFYRPKSKIKN